MPSERGELTARVASQVYCVFLRRVERSAAELSRRLKNGYLETTDGDKATKTMLVLLVVDFGDLLFLACALKREREVGVCCAEQANKSMGCLHASSSLRVCVNLGGNVVCTGGERRIVCRQTLTATAI